MNTKDDGGQAFPVPAGNFSGGQSHSSDEGMSLRDYFAAKAMTGYSARNLKADTDGDWPSYADIARWAYEQADAMIAERAK